MYFAYLACGFSVPSTRLFILQKVLLILALSYNYFADKSDNLPAVLVVVFNYSEATLKNRDDFI